MPSERSASYWPSSRRCRNVAWYPHARDLGKNRVGEVALSRNPREPESIAPLSCEFRIALNARNSRLTANDFFDTVVEVYTAMVDSDRGLRDLVVKHLHENPEWLVDDKIKDLTGDLGDFLYDLLVYVHKHGAFKSSSLG